MYDEARQSICLKQNLQKFLPFSDQVVSVTTRSPDVVGHKPTFVKITARMRMKDNVIQAYGAGTPPHQCRAPWCSCCKRHGGRYHVFISFNETAFRKVRELFFFLKRRIV